MNSSTNTAEYSGWGTDLITLRKNRSERKKIDGNNYPNKFPSQKSQNASPVAFCAAMRQKNETQDTPSKEYGLWTRGAESDWGGTGDGAADQRRRGRTSGLVQFQSIFESFTFMKHFDFYIFLQKPHSQRQSRSSFTAVNRAKINYPM